MSDWLKADPDTPVLNRSDLAKPANRPNYRRYKRKEVGVKVYTVNEESRYIYISNIPSLGGVIEELVKKMSIYGVIEEYRMVDDLLETEDFTDVMWVKYAHINNARHAKRKAVQHPFYANILEIQYAPQDESVDDTRVKLQQRQQMVLNRYNKRNPGEPPVLPPALPPAFQPSVPLPPPAPATLTSGSSSQTPVVPPPLTGKQEQLIGPQPNPSLSQPIKKRRRI